MRVARLVAVAVLAWALAGCAEIMNDRIIGDHPWQPGDALGSRGK